jgi:hypothetical protein
MRFLNYLQEAYACSFTARKQMGPFAGGYTEVFKNPTPKEMKSASDASGDLAGSVRFIADYIDKNLFVFKSSVFHEMCEKALKRDSLLSQESFPGWNAIWGAADLEHGHLVKLYADSSHKTDKIFKDKTLDDKWTVKWFGMPLLPIIKNISL